MTGRTRRAWVALGAMALLVALALIFVPWPRESRPPRKPSSPREMTTAPERGRRRAKSAERKQQEKRPPLKTSAPPGGEESGPIAISGHVFRAEDGAPIRGASVDLLEYPSRGAAIAQIPPAQERLATTATDGSYELAVPIDFRGYVRASAIGYAAEVSDLISAEAAIDFWLEELQSLVGRAVDAESGEGAAGAAVKALRMETFRGKVLQEAAAETGEEGWFVLRELPGSVELWVVVVHPDYAVARRHVFLPCAPLIVELTKGAAIRGRVTRAGSGLPVEGAQVEAVGVEGCRAKSDAEGRYELKHVPDGGTPILLKASKAGLGARTAIEEGIGQGEERVVDFELPGTCTLRGLVLDGEGHGLGGVRIRALGLDTRKAFSLDRETLGTSLGDGTFEVQGLERLSPYSVCFEKEGFAREAVAVRTPDEDVVDLDPVRLPPGCTLQGLVTFKGTGRPLASARVRLMAERDPGEAPAGDNLAWAVYTDHRGEYTFLNVPAGPCRMMVQARTGQMWGGEVTVAGRVRKDIEIEVGHAVEGRVLSPEGEPVPRARCFLRSRMGTRPPDYVEADDGGRFVFPAVPDGLYELEIDAPPYGVQAKQVILSGRDAEEEVRLEDGLEIAGQVMTPSGDPVPRCIVVAVVSGGAAARRKVFRVRADQEGRFSVRRLGREPYDFVILDGRTEEWLGSTQQEGKPIRPPSLGVRIVTSRVLR